MLKRKIVEYVRGKLRFSAAGQQLPGVYDMTGRRIQSGDVVSVHDSSGRAISATPKRVTGVNPAAGRITAHQIDRPAVLAQPIGTDAHQFRVIDQKPPVRTEALNPQFDSANPAAAISASGESHNVASLPAADASKHRAPDLTLANMTPQVKFQNLMMGEPKASALKAGLKEWSGRDIPESDIMDMMGVPRHHPMTKSADHPAYFSGLEADGEPLPPTAGRKTQFAETGVNTVGGYGFLHMNLYKHDNEGKPYIYVDVVQHKGDIDGSKEVSMPHLLWNMATAAHRNGIRKIKLHAAMGGTWSGGVYWPKVGFDMNLKKAHADSPNNYKRRLDFMNSDPVAFGVGEKQPEQYTLQDYLSHPQGYADYFHDTGKSNKWDTRVKNPNALDMKEMEFDTHPESRSMKLLANYLRKFEAKGAKQ